MSEQDGKRRASEKRITDELANQPKQDDDGSASAQSKEKRAQAEKELRESK